jgi:hypothetical protein
VRRIAEIPNPPIDTGEFARQFVAFTSAKLKSNDRAFKQIWQDKLDVLCLANIQEK